MDNTWIKLYRKFDEWEWFNVSEMVHLFIYLLINANNKDKEWHGIIVKRGQLVTGRKIISGKTGISEQTIRTCLKKLEITKELTIKPTNRYSIITICNYDKYQPEYIATNQLTNQQLTSDQPATNHKQDIKEDKNVKKKKPPKSADFIDEIVNCFAEVHGNYQILSKGKEKAAAGKILQVYKRKYPDSTSEETLIGLKEFFIQCVNIKDKWLHNNMSLPTIEARFNEITKTLKNEKSTGATPYEIANAIAKNFATDYQSSDKPDDKGESSVSHITRAVL